MGGFRATMAFTDPPWNVAIGQDSNPRHRQRAGLQNDCLSPQDFQAFLSAFAAHLASYLAGDLYCVLGASEWPTLDLQLRNCGYHWSATIIWVKDTFVLGRSKYHRRYEPVWYGWHAKGKSSFAGARDVDDVWEIPRPRRSDEHPTMKPLELVARAVRNSCGEGGVVCDPFLGSGTTMAAAQALGRVCCGIEIEPKYVAVVLERLAEMGLKPEPAPSTSRRPLHHRQRV
jgi:DNA modification methylase